MFLIKKSPFFWQTTRCMDSISRIGANVKLLGKTGDQGEEKGVGNIQEEERRERVDVMCM